MVQLPTASVSFQEACKAITENYKENYKQNYKASPKSLGIKSKCLPDRNLLLSFVSISCQIHIFYPKITLSYFKIKLSHFSWSVPQVSREAGTQKTLFFSCFFHITLNFSSPSILPNYYSQQFLASTSLAIFSRSLPQLSVLVLLSWQSK